MSDEGGRIVIKSEVHASKDDLKKELELLQSGEFDAIVFENARKNVEEVTDHSLMDRIMNYPFFFFGHLQADNRPLLAAAWDTDTRRFFTRESNADVITGLPTPFPRIVQVVWISLLILTVLFAGGGGRYTIASLGGFIVLFILPLAIRDIRGRFFEDMNRNQLIADTATEAQAEEGRTLLITGHKHGPKVESHLPDELVENHIPRSYGFRSRKGVLNLWPGLLLALFLMGSVFLGIALLSHVLLFPVVAPIL